MPNTQHRRKVANYRRRRLILIAALGGRCVRCSEPDPEKLEFHHTEERQWTAKELSRWQRQLRYEEEWESGLIELLCGDCNKRAGKPNGNGHVA